MHRYHCLLREKGDSVTDRELKKLSRADLLELLLIQTRETERMRQKVHELEEKLEQRQYRLAEIGSLAEAMLEVNNVIAVAQAAADQYLENIAAIEAETRQRCEEMLQAAAVNAPYVAMDEQQEMDP